MRFGKAVDHAVNGFANAGYIWCSIGILIILLDVDKAFFSLLP